MVDQTPTLGALSSVFQLAAGVALAISFFREPFDRRYLRLGAILDREEQLLEGREDGNAGGQADRVLAARVNWLAKRAELEPTIDRRMVWIKAAVALSVILLIAATIAPNQPIGRWIALALCMLALAPLFFGWLIIDLHVRDSLKTITAEIERL